MMTKVVIEEMRKTEEDAAVTRMKKKTAGGAILTVSVIAATDVMTTRPRSDPVPRWSTETTTPITTPGPTEIGTPPVWTIETLDAK